MAGRVKHMERSRRSHRKDTNTYANFHRHAYTVRYIKENRKQTFGQRFSSMLAPLKQALRKTAEK